MNIKKIDGLRQYFELLIITLVTLSPFFINFNDLIYNKWKLIGESQKAAFSIREIFISFLLQTNKPITSVLFFIIAIFVSSKLNKDIILNSGNQYHRHSYLYYWLCSHILRIKSCSLIRIPIYMQFLLINRDTFTNYDFGESELYKEIEEELIETKKINITNENYTKWINVVISDTYQIEDGILPSSVLSNSTIIIQRKNNEVDKTRVYSHPLITTVRNCINTIGGKHSLNIFATTNAKNTYYLVNNVFKAAGRDNIEQLRVYSQPYGEKNVWKFEDKGIKIF